MLRNDLALPINPNALCKIIRGSKTIEFRRHPVPVNEQAVYPLVCTESKCVEGVIVVKNGERYSYAEAKQLEPLLPDHYAYEPVVYGWDIIDYYTFKDPPKATIVQKYPNLTLWSIAYEATNAIH